MGAEDHNEGPEESEWSTGSESDEAVVVNLFLQRYLDDRGQGRVRSIESYRAMFPDFERLIERHFEVLRDAAEANLNPNAASSLNIREAGEKNPGERTQDDPGTPKRVGPFRIVGVLGEGGMGIVYHAEQESPVRRKVALKVMKPSLSRETSTSRFEWERQALALMDHPNIARVFEAGTDHGCPYFAMEYIEGERITEFCDRRRLTIRERLAIFLEVCRGLQHAHQKRIIHRDLKPSNILVTEQDNEAIPKIIDFGLAKPTLRLDLQKTMISEHGLLLGTPAFMSPEQVSFADGDIDTRTDVYSLGVILYELVAGALPFEFERRRISYSELEKRICEEEPRKPSRKVTELEKRGSKAPELRSTTARSLGRCLSGDLDWIVLKSLEKERNRRYQTVTELAADLVRFLRNEPVIASSGTGYRLKKFLQRNVLAIGVGSLMLVLAVAGTAGWILGELRTSRQIEERIKIEETAKDLERDLSGFLQSILADFDPRLGGRDVRLIDILREKDAELERRFGDKPEIEAAIRNIYGTSFAQMGILDEAERHMRRAEELRSSLGRHQKDHLIAANNLAYALMKQERWKEAEDLLRQILSPSRRVLGENDPITLKVMNNLGLVLHRQFKDRPYQASLTKHDSSLEAEELYRESLMRRSAVLGEGHPETANAMSNLAQLLMDRNKLEEAKTLLEEALSRQTRKGEQKDRITLNLKMVLAGLMRRMGDVAAEETYRQTLQDQRTLLGPSDQDTLVTMRQLGRLLVEQGRPAEAEPLLRSALEARRLLHGEKNPETVSSMNDLAGALKNQEKLAEAKKLYREALGLAVTMDLAPRVPAIKQNLACTLVDEGRELQEAKTLLEELLGGEIAMPRLEGVLHCTYGRLMDKLGDGHEARKHLQAGCRILDEALGAQDPFTQRARKYLHELDAAGNSDGKR